MIFIFSSCAQPVRRVNIQKRSKVALLSIKNQLVFEELGVDLYELAADRLLRAGYDLVHRQRSDYVINISVHDFKPLYKLVAPDIIVVAANIQVTLAVEIFDHEGKLCAQQCFTDAATLFRYRNGGMSDSREQWAYRRLFARMLIRIERYCRNFIT